MYRTYLDDTQEILTVLIAPGEHNGQGQGHTQE